METATMKILDAVAEKVGSLSFRKATFILHIIQHTGLPQLTLEKMDEDAMESCTDGNILQLLDEHHCYDPAASQAVCNRLAKLKEQNVVHKLSKTALPLFCIGQIKLKLRQLNGRKAAGPDNIPPWVLKQFHEELAPFISDLFNSCVEHCIFPQPDLRRLVYIPFSGPKISDVGGAQARVELKAMRDEEPLSSCVRTLIWIGQKFREKGWKEVLQQGEVWAREMPNVLKDTLINYGILHWYTSKDTW
ncbi:Hypp6135 [Branchiostoma lanceolatum]|uniref:Hypp6135 protein n=1 Tax=Branchiostoma lanceolatum TaxID=7740 RepID=A0A8J9W8W9_BRALA|nr:Hypp6135 [Branchiostoma lanceolatum]